MILKVENLSFGYTKDKVILNNINFNIEKGDIVSVLGPNGAGKTTLLRSIMGLNKLNSGKALLYGNEINSISKKDLWKTISYVPQAKNANSSYTVKETVLLGRSSYISAFSLPNEDDITKTENILKKLQIYDVKDKYTNKISGGELQMVLIAKALVSEPELLILDEPESNLDFKNQLIVLDTLSNLAKEGTACLFNTHYPNHALQRSNKAILLDGKGNSIFGKTEDVVTEENIKKIFGVNALIREVETDTSTILNVTPVSLFKKTDIKSNTNTLSVMSITVKDNTSAQAVNSILHENRHLIAGRMGMPYKKYALNIINVTLDGKKQELELLTKKIISLNGVNVKTIYIDEE